MEIKVSFKDGEKSSSFKFEGDLGEILAGITDQVSGVMGSVLKLVDDPVDNAK